MTIVCVLADGMSSALPEADSGVLARSTCVEHAETAIQPSATVSQHECCPPVNNLSMTVVSVLADGMSSEPSEADSDALARSAHAEQDEALRQANRARSQTQQQQSPAQQQQSQGSVPEQVAAVQDSTPGAAEPRQNGAVQQPPVSPFSRATVHRQIGR